MTATFVFPGQRSWPSLQSMYFDPADGCLKRCLVSLTIGREGRRVELADVVFLEDARRWTQSPMSLELQYNDQQGEPLLDQTPRSPARDHAICCPDGCTLVQRIGAGFCHLLLTDAQQRVKWQRRWDADLGLIDVDFQSQTVYLPHYAKGVVRALRYPEMQPSNGRTLCHQRLVTAERVVAKSRYVAVDGFILDNNGATVPGLAVFDVEQSELLCAATLPDSLGKGWSFIVTDDGRLMLTESTADRDTNRFRLYGYTRSGDLDYTVKLMAATQQPWRLELVRDNLGRDYLREEDGEARLLAPVDVYLRKERLDPQRLTSARKMASSSGYPQSI